MRMWLSDRGLPPHKLMPMLGVHKALHRTGLIGKHFARMQSKMLTNESCGRACRFGVRRHTHGAKHRDKGPGSDMSALVAAASDIAGKGPIELIQDDTFFHCAAGRLKLRTFADGQGELIFYRRADEHGPKE
jgi:hypothetical protein